MFATGRADRKDFYEYRWFTQGPQRLSALSRYCAETAIASLPFGIFKSSIPGLNLSQWRCQMLGYYAIFTSINKSKCEYLSISTAFCL